MEHEDGHQEQSWMSARKMRTAIYKAPIYHPIEVVFALKKPGVDAQEYIMRLLIIFGMNTRSFEFSSDQDKRRFVKALESGEWTETRIFSLHLIHDFDPDFFIARTVDCGMIESVCLVE